MKGSKTTTKPNETGPVKDAPRRSYDVPKFIQTVEPVAAALSSVGSSKKESPRGAVESPTPTKEQATAPTPTAKKRVRKESLRDEIGYIRSALGDTAFTLAQAVMESADGAFPPDLWEMIARSLAEAVIAETFQ